MTSSYPPRNPQSHARILPPIMVDHVNAVSRLQQDLQSIDRLAVDTESNSLFAYQERVCLIQISLDTQDYLVDPLRLSGRADLSFLGRIFANPRIEKVLHAAEYDVMTMRRDFGFEFHNLFDTMVASRILGLERVGLGPLLEERFDIKLDKKHQRANWGKRPLTPDMIRYAQLDTHYLLKLRDELYDQLRRADRLEEARELFHEVAQAKWGGTDFDPQGFWRLTGTNHLHGPALAVLEALYHFREQQARHRDLPVFKIISDETLVKLASLQPASPEELAEIPGIGQGLMDRYASDLLLIIRESHTSPPPTRPKQRHVQDEIVQRRFDVLHTWRKERAAKRGVSSEVILSKDALWELAQLAPKSRRELETIQSLGPWRLEAYGDELLAILASLDS